MSVSDDDKPLSKEATERLEAMMTTMKNHLQKREWIEKRLSEPNLPKEEHEELMYLYHRPETRGEDLSNDGQCRSNLKRLQKNKKWPKHDELLVRLCGALTAHENKDKLLALMAMKHQSRDSPGKSWKKALIWLLKSWNWLSEISALDAETWRSCDVECPEPVIQRTPTEEDEGRIQEMIWHLLPKIGGNARAWQLAAEEQAIHRRKVEGVKCSAIGADLGMSEDTVRQRKHRDKKRGNSRP